MFDNLVTLLKKVAKDSFTERDGTSYCIGRELGAAGGFALIVKFIQISAPTDAQITAYGIALAAIIGAVALKNISEVRRKEEQ